MNKKLFLLLTIAFAIISISNATIISPNVPSMLSIEKTSSTFEIDGIKYEIINNDEKKVAVNWVVDKSITTCTIPSSVTWAEKVYSVTSISSQAFYYCTNLSSVFIPESVISIYSSFKDCTSLSSVTLPNSLRVIGESAFSGCVSLKSISIPNNVYYIGGYAFERCTGLTSITIPNSVNYLGDGAFKNCSHLTDLRFEDGSNTITTSFSMNDLPFKGCPLETLYLGREISSDPSLFCKNSQLKILTIGSYVTSIDDNAFYSCPNLISVSIPNSITSIGDAAFSSCSSLTSVTIPNSVKSIGSGAFHSCSGLTSIIIPNNVISIGKAAFRYCSALTSVSIPNSVTSIDESVFEGCSSLTSITIPNSITSIGKDAFSQCKGLSSVSIPRSVISIGEAAFFGCSGLTSVSIPMSVTSIEPMVFKLCTSLYSISIPKSVTSIGTQAFQNCKGLTSISIPNSVTYIGDWAFEKCTSLHSISIPNSVTYLGEGVFNDCHTKVFMYIKEPIEYRSIFYGTSNNQLYVPSASLSKYRAAEGWKNLFICSLMSISKNGEIPSNVLIKGVTADGLSKLDVYQGNVFDPQKIKIRFEVNGEEFNDPAIIGTCSDIGQIGLNMWGFVYTSPKDYPKSIDGNHYTINVTLALEENNLESIVGEAQIEVYRPGVLMVHGFNSDSDCFHNFANYLKKFGYEDCQLRNVNYQSTNKANFDFNTVVVDVIGNNARELFSQLLSEGIVSSSCDMVGHSMGGILIRKYAQETDRAKTVNRIITVNTPHSGSELGNFVSDLLDHTKKMNLRNKMVLDIFENIFESIGMWGAVKDLSVNSEAIQNLNSTMVAKPSHAICSNLDINEKTKGNEIDAYTQGIMNKFGYAILVEYFLNERNEVAPSTDIELLNTLFGEKMNDGIVSLESQLGGLSEQNKTATVFHSNYEGFLGFSSKTHHCNITKCSDAEGKIAELLFMPKSSEVFSQNGFSPQSYNIPNNARKKYADNATHFKDPSESQFVKLNYYQDDIARILKVKVNGSSDVISNIVSIPLDDDIILCGINQNEYQFQIPDIYGGDLTIYVLGRTEDNALVGDSIVTTVDRSASLNYLFFENWPEITMTEGQQLEMTVRGGWSNGKETPVLPVYSTDNYGVLSIDKNIITAQQQGECNLIASYEGLADTLKVLVVPAQTTNIKSLKTIAKPLIKYANDLITIVPNNNYSGKITVEICNTQGVVYYQSHRQVSVQGGEPILFNLYHLPSQLYILKIKMYDQYVMKFYK